MYKSLDKKYLDDVIEKKTGEYYYKGERVFLTKQDRLIMNLRRLREVNTRLRIEKSSHKWFLTEKGKVIESVFKET